MSITTMSRRALEAVRGGMWVNSAGEPATREDNPWHCFAVVFGPKLYGPTRGFSSLPQASSLPEATVEHCRCGDLTLARPGVPCGRCGELP